MNCQILCRCVLVLIIAASPAAQGYCLEDWACLEVVEQGEEIQFWIVNQRPYPFTATLDVKTRNLRSAEKASDRYSPTIVLSGDNKKKILSLYPQNPRQRTSYRDVFYWTPGVMNAVHDDSVIYDLPFAEGENYPLVQGFGGGWSHRGGSRFAVDFAMPEGSAVHAARGGVVVRTVSHHSRGGASRRYINYANYIVIQHDDGTTGEYHHLMRDGVVVEVGTEVARGDLIGYSGNTGFSSLPHLHFAVYRPLPFGDFESIRFRFSRSALRRW